MRWAWHSRRSCSPPSSIVPATPSVDHRTWVFLGDGCMMEGISHEVSSLAGTLHLNKLVAFYDDNHISIDGDTKGWFGDDTPKRFEAYGWNVIPTVDGNDADAVTAAIEAALKSSDKPTLICCRTVIGWGSPTRPAPRPRMARRWVPMKLPPRA